MKKILATLAIAALFTSCKKENIDTPAQTEGKKLKKIIYQDQGSMPETETIGYDAKGRIANYTSESYIYDFTYETDTRLVVASRKKSDNSPSTTYECDLNAKGAVTKMLYKSPAGNLTYTYLYTYDANNQMTRVEGFSPNGQGYEMETELVNGNSTNIKHFNNGAVNGTSVYTYAGAKACKLPFTLSSYWPSHVLFGKSNAQLPTEYKRYNAAGTITSHYKSTYEFDADGDVTKITTNYLNNGTTGTITYQYQ